MAITFDPSEYDTPVPFKEIPDGEHEFLVLDSQFKVWESDDFGNVIRGSVSFKLNCLTEGFDEKWLYAAFDIAGTDDKKVKQNRGWLVQFHKACGVEKIADYETPTEVNDKKVIGTVQTYNGKKTFLKWGWKPCGAPLASNGSSGSGTVSSASSGVKAHDDDFPFV